MDMGHEYDKYRKRDEIIKKITVIKSLALLNLIQILTVLPPRPADNIFKDIQKSFHKFLWNGKRDNVKREILTNSYEG
jgi:hypothetical protein